jgi:hypothetical protein
MADFLPIGLGRDANGNVSGFQEIKTTDIIPENYLEVNNETAKWNASGLVGYSVSAVAPTNAYVLTWDSSLNAWVPKVAGAGGSNAAELQGEPICANSPTSGQFLVYNGSSWCPSNVVITGGGGGGGGGVCGTGSIGRIPAWTNTNEIGNWTPTIDDGNVITWDGGNGVPKDGGWTFDTNATDGKLIYWDNGNNIIKGTNLTPADVLTDATNNIYNANRIQGTSACPTAPSAGQALVYNSTIGAWCPSTLPTSSDATKIHGYDVPDPDIGPQPIGDVLIFTGTGYDWEPRVKSTNTLTANKILIGDGDNSVCASPITLNTFGNTADGNVIRFLSATPSIQDGGWGIAQSAVVNIGNDRILQWSTDGGKKRIVDSGYKRTDAAWNADKIVNFPINTDILNGGVEKIIPVWTGTGVPPYDPSSIYWDYGANLFDPASIIGAVGNLIPPEGVVGGVSPILFGQTGAGDNQFSLLAPSATSSIPDGAFLVASGGTFVYGYLPNYLVRYFGAQSSGFPSLLSTEPELVPSFYPGAVLYLDYDNERWTWTNQLLVKSTGVEATNVSSTGTVRAVTLSATNYLNLPSSTIVWASANYANLAGSSTSALNAQQAPNGFNVTGTLLATTVSATNYRNIRPYVSSVDSSTTTSVNISGDYDTYLVNTTTTSVTLYLPDASAWTSKQITVSKIDDGGSYRSVTLSGATLQTATNTVRLYDPTESVTVISNGTNWYSLDYDRAYGVVVVAKNSTGSTLTKGTPVKVTGATGDNVLIGAVSAANNHVPQATDGNLTRCIGVVEHDIPNGEFGHVLTKGTLYKFNTNAYNEGDVLYLASGGGFTNVKPPAPYDEVFLGIVTRKQSVNGSILIDIANPIHINDIVGFNLASSLVNGDLISYDTTTSTFKNVQTVNVSGQGKFGSVSATNLSATNITATDLTFSGKINSQKYPTYIYTATGISVAANKLMFDMFNGTGSGKTLKVTRLVAYVRNTTTITGINQVLECYRTSSVGTGGTAITAGKMVTTDPDLNANITARNTPTNNAAYYIPSGVLAAANIYTEEGQNLQERVFLYVYDSFAGLEECLTLQEGEGLRIITGAQGAAGVIAIYAYFITV